MALFCRHIKLFEFIDSVSFVVITNRFALIFFRVYNFKSHQYIAIVIYNSEVLAK